MKGRVPHPLTQQEERHEKIAKESVGYLPFGSPGSQSPSPENQKWAEAGLHLPVETMVGVHPIGGRRQPDSKRDENGACHRLCPVSAVSDPGVAITTAATARKAARSLTSLGSVDYLVGP